MRKLTFILLMLLPCLSLAITQIPKETGFSGYINLGLVTGQAESNLLYKVLGNQVSADGADLQNPPESESIILPITAGEVSYAWADTSTQVFLGTLLEDFVRFDSSTRLGVRQSLDSIGIASFALLNGGAISAAKIWQDPYDNSSRRQDTSRTSKGFRLGLDNIGRSYLGIHYSFRDIDIVDEKSGQSLLDQGVINAQQQRSLLRDGTYSTLELSYSQPFSQQHLLYANVKLVDHDLDGKAMAYDGYNAEISWIYQPKPWRFVTNLAYGEFSSKAENPIFSQRNDFYRVGGSVTTFYQDAFGLKNWNASVGFIYLAENSDIAFYDQQISSLMLGMLYKF